MEAGAEIVQYSILRIFNGGKSMGVVLTVIGVIVGILVILAAATFFTVNQQMSAVVQFLGKFSRIAPPGLNMRIPFLESIAGRISLRVQQLDVRVETKTHDNVFVYVVVSVQYHVIPDRVYEAFYKLSDPQSQMSAYIFDVVRARVPTIKLDDVFEKKDDIAEAIKEELTHIMDNFGYGILRALVTDIDPDPKVKAAMNDINAAQRQRVAATEKGEADRIIKVKGAEAEAQSKALQGKGIAEQRRAIVEGLRESVDAFQQSVPGTRAQDIMNLVLMTQYFDTLKEVGGNSRSNTLLMAHSPSALTELTDQIRKALMAEERAMPSEDQ